LPVVCTCKARCPRVCMLSMVSVPAAVPVETSFVHLGLEAAPRAEVSKSSQKSKDDESWQAPLAPPPPIPPAADDPPFAPPLAVDPPLAVEPPLLLDPPLAVEPPLLLDPPLAVEPPLLLAPPLAVEPPLLLAPPLAVEPPLPEPPVPLLDGELAQAEAKEITIASDSSRRTPRPKREGTDDKLRVMFRSLRQSVGGHGSNGRCR